MSAGSMTSPLSGTEAAALNECFVKRFVTPDGRLVERAMNPLEFVAKFEEIRPHAKDESGRVVTYLAGAWIADEDWLSQVLFVGLGRHWTTGLRTKYAEALRDSASVVGLGSEEYLNFQNVLVHWRTGNAHEHSPEWCGTVQLGTSWDPEGECPNWLRFIEVSVPVDAVEFVQELCGYVLYLGNPFQVAFLLHGPAASGKSTFLRILIRLIGSSSTSSRSLQELSKDRFATSDLYGKLANFCGDIDATRIEETAAFKRIVGGDMITAQRKMEKAFDFAPVAKLIFSANELPRSADVSGGWFRRWLLVPFPNGGRRHCPGFEESLEGELPGIGRWAVEGLQRLMARGHFEPPASVLEAGEEYRKEIDSVAGWLDGMEAYESGAPERGLVLHSMYKAYCDEAGVGAVAAMKFYKRLNELGVPKVIWSGSRNAWYRLRCSP